MERMTDVIVGEKLEVKNKKGSVSFFCFLKVFKKYKPSLSYIQGRIKFSLVFLNVFKEYSKSTKDEEVVFEAYGCGIFFWKLFL